MENILSVNELLIRQATSYSDKTIYTFLNEKGEKKSQITFAELLLCTKRIASQLVSLNNHSQTILLLLPNGPEFIKIFFGCIYAGMIPIPTPIPNDVQIQSKLASLIKSSQSRVIICSNDLKDKLQRLLPKEYEKNLCILLAEELECGNFHSSSLETPIERLDRIAFLQYTSGSTSEPKGVMVSHENILANEKMIQESFKHDSESIIVGWLPFFHDMGLVGNILQPLYIGSQVILINPSTFLKKPLLWLDTISKYKAITSGGPNFAFDLCCKTYHSNDHRFEGDLSSLKVLFNGAEPIKTSTLKEFAKTFSPYGFREKSFFPCYGMAETTLYVSGCKYNQIPSYLKVNHQDLSQKQKITPSFNESYSLVSSGFIHPSQQIQIVNPETRKIASAGSIGEIWVRGPNVAKGYWNNDSLTKETFHNFLEGSSNEPYLKTGDLGFIHKGELYITGRLKDLIIIHGKNIYPQDIEETALSSDSFFEKAFAGAFSISSLQDQKVVLIIGVPNSFNTKIGYQLSTKIQNNLFSFLSIHIDEIVFTRRNQIPFTTSGKVQRSLLKRKYMTSDLPVLSSSLDYKVQNEISDFDKNFYPDFNDKLLSLTTFISKLTGIKIENLNPHIPLIRLGIDSLQTTSLGDFLAKKYHLSEDIGNLAFNHSIISLLQLSLTSANKPKKEKLKLESQSQSGPLSSGQHAIYFLSQIYEDQSQYCLFKSFDVEGNLDEKALERSISDLVNQYPFLKTQLVEHEGIIKQEIKSSNLKFLTKIDTDEKKLIEDFFHAKVEPNKPLFQVFLNKTSSPLRIIFFIHHIITDLWSASLLFAKWKDLYLQHTSGTSPQKKHSSFLTYIDFVHEQQDYLKSHKSKKDKSFWLDMLENYPPSLKLPIDKPRPKIQSHIAYQESFKVGKNELSKLKNFCTKSSIHFSSLCLSAYFILLNRYSNQDDIVVGIPLNIRPSDKYRNVIGYFVNTLPIRNNDISKSNIFDLLLHINQKMTQAHLHKQFPVMNLAQDLNFSRDLSISPLYQALFTFQQTPSNSDNELLIPILMQQKSNPLSLKDLTLYPQIETSSGIDVDIDLALCIYDESLFGYFKYNNDIFNKESILRMMHHYLNILKAIPENTDKCVSELEIFSPQEIRERLVDFNRHEEIFDEPSCLHVFMEKIAKEDPESIAIKHKENEMSYRTLNSEADLLANCLLEIENFEDKNSH